MTTDTELDLTPWRTLEDAINSGDAARLRADTESLGARESARALSRLSAEQQTYVLVHLEPAYAADLIEEIAGTQAGQLFRNLAPEQAAPIVAAMVSDAAADLLARLGGELREAILDRLPAKSAARLRKLVSYAPNVAGGLMITEYLAYPDTFTTQQVIEDMRAHSDAYSEYSVQYTYVIADSGQLLGVLPLRDLLLTPSNVPITKIMIKNPIAVKDNAPLDELADFFERHGFIAAPVCDSASRLVGVVRRTDVMAALGARAESDYMKAQGITSGDELRSMPLLLRSRRRLSWLSINILLNMVAASIIAVYQDTLASAIALAVFLPIISDMSGCSGNQAVAVSMRELSLGLIKPFEVFHVWLKEISVGLLNGIVLGILLAIVAIVWKGNPWLGAVAGGALALNTVVAVSIGGTIPLLLKRLGFDPALASGPILTTVTDMCGFFFVLSFASGVLPYLTTA